MKIYVIDAFCGMGGSSLGIRQAKDKLGQSIAELLACINHDLGAIKIHQKNFPSCLHYREDVRFLNLRPLVELVKQLRKTEPDLFLFFHASIDCTQHSRAKGGQKKNADSRTLAWELYRYIEQLKPDYITIENVEEFRKWGPDDRDGKPIKEMQGVYFQSWCDSINEHYGYKNDWRMLNSANFGAHQSRDRLFGIFAKPHLPIEWPQPTHTQHPDMDGMLFEQLLPWNPVSEVLDLSNCGHSIFTRKVNMSLRPQDRNNLEDSTIWRILGGLKKYGNEPFLSAYYGNGINARPIAKPAQTLTTKDRLSLITPKSIQWLDKQYTGPHNHQSVTVPAHTLTTNPKLHLVTATNGTLESPYWTPLEEDSEAMLNLRAYMRQMQIFDLYYRGLTIYELLLIQGFPLSYQVEGSKSKQKKYIGNSVVPLVQQRLIESLHHGLAKFLISRNDFQRGNESLAYVA